MKHYIVIRTTIFDYEESRAIHSCKDYNTAQKFFRKHLKNARVLADINAWKVENDKADLYEAGEEGYYLQSHVTVELLEVEMV